MVVSFFWPSNTRAYYLSVIINVTIPFVNSIIHEMVPLIIDSMCNPLGSGTGYTSAANIVRSVSVRTFPDVEDTVL